jgi:predicted CopG family antitoxin
MRGLSIVGRAVDVASVPRLDLENWFVHGSCMGKTITIDDNAYKLLSSLKRDPRDSFTKVILRHIHKPAETCGELLEATENDPPPQVNLEVLNHLARSRGRRSGGRK